LPDDAKQKLIDRLGETIEVKASESRSQFRTRALARQQLKEKLETGLEKRTRRRKTRPSRASKKKRVADKRARGDVKRLRSKPKADD
jgi:ribosome-associated protein